MNEVAAEILPVTAAYRSAISELDGIVIVTSNRDVRHDPGCSKMATLPLFGLH